MTQTLGDDFPIEQERVRELLIVYTELGSVGAFGAMCLRQVLKRADEAAISGDIVAMLRSYQELRECK